MEEIEILPEYKKALELMASPNNALFVGGEAGVGKSTLIRYVSSTAKNCVVLAPTASAAINAGGDTIHSFFSLPARHIDSSEKLRFTPKSKEAAIAMEALVIDEASMVTPNIVDAMDKMLRKARKSVEPFGGVSALFVGDLLQLPPIVSTKEEELYFKERYESMFFYSADVFCDIPITPLTLSKVRRQSDAEFVGMLNLVREGKELQMALEYFNDKCHKSLSGLDNPLWLVSTNATAHAINSKRLTTLPGETKIYKAKISGAAEGLKSRLPVADSLELKEGAKVVFLRNNRQKGWINGDTGVILSMGENSVIVRKDSTKEALEVERASWERYEYSYDEKSQTIEKKEVGSFEQLPLSLGWALTIHKSQGMTLDSVVVDLGARAFCDGQTYVALSRCKDINNVRLARRLSQKDIMVNKEALRFYEGLKR